MKYAFCLLIFLGLSGVCFGQQPIGDGIDCSDIRIDFVDNPNLTREERLILMEEAFYKSLEKYERCQEARAKARSTESALPGATGQDSGMNGPGTDAMDSVASPGMSGTQPQPADPDVQALKGDSQGSEPAGTQRAEEMDAENNAGTDTDSGGAALNSLDTEQVPDDIPPAANDDALAAQIRYAAENETDPQKRAQLWNEYRKYKGLPQK